MTTITRQELDLLAETMTRILAPRFTPEHLDGVLAAGWDERLWDAIEDTGLTLIAADTDPDGAGGAWHAAAEIAVQAGRYAAAVPLIETQIAAWLLARCGADIPSGPMSVSLGGEAGVVRRVPYGRIATAVVVASLDGEAVRTVRPRGEVRCEGANLAGEPRDDLDVDPAGESYPVTPGVLALAGALLRLLRAAQILGAAEQCLELTVGYVREREQFGRALAGFQAVQQQIAIMAGETALMRAAVDGATAALAGAVDDAAGDVQSHAAFAVDSAKAQVGVGATQVARIAHQLHGAIGTTREHRLRLATTRLWAWSAEDGSEQELCTRLGAQMLAARPGTLWPTIAR